MLKLFPLLDMYGDPLGAVKVHESFDINRLCNLLPVVGPTGDPIALMLFVDPVTPGDRAALDAAVSKALSRNQS